MPKELYSGVYLGTMATVGDLKQSYAEEDRLKALAANPRPELNEIAGKLIKRAEEIVKEKSLPFDVGYRQAARENPDLIRRYGVLTAKAQRSGGISNDD